MTRAVDVVAARAVGKRAGSWGAWLADGVVSGHTGRSVSAKRPGVLAALTAAS